MGGGGAAGFLQGLLLATTAVHGSGTAAVVAMATIVDIGEEEQQVEREHSIQSVQVCVFICIIMSSIYKVQS